MEHGRHRSARRAAAAFAAAALLGACASTAAPQPLPAFDFTQADQVRLWEPAHDVAPLAAAPEGMLVRITGADPYIQGPPRDYPSDTPLWVTVRRKSDEAGACQLFYYTAAAGATEADSVRLGVPKAGAWVSVRAAMPPLGPGTRLRLDPPGVKGTCLLASIAFEPRVLPKEPAWPTPTAPQVPAGAPAVTSGALRLRHAAGQIGGFVVEVAGAPVAVGHTRPLIGYAAGGQMRWVDVAQVARVSVSARAGRITVAAAFADPDGADWTLRQVFGAASAPDALDVTTTVTVGKDREVSYLPLLVLLPGLGSFGSHLDHAVFAGLEYMDAPDTSSSEADIVGPGSKRQVPDTLKVTFPLMAIQRAGRYVGLIWDYRPELSAVFDAPDRLFHSGGHLMGVLYPGSDGTNRVEGSLLPYGGRRLAAGETLTLKATIVGGRGASVIPAVKQYVRLRGLPPVPSTGMDRAAYAAYASAGWLDSRIGENGLYRHAYWPGVTSFAPGPAADAAVWMEWLARVTADAALKARLDDAARAALAHVAPASYGSASVSHVAYPVAALVYGHVAENTRSALASARDLLARFEPDGTVPYRRAAGALDYGRTHFAPDANGLTAQVVASLLQDATVCGDPEMIRAGLRVLRAMDKFDNSAPRGAQTWEVPLHTPDILGSAYLVRAYTLGYELTGDRAMLRRAIDWAWTGVPFTYLVNPTDQPVGPYATIPVFGATQWTGSWFGLPVQWCGLVYSDALYRLIRHDPADAATWKRLADGIAASGIQQSFPKEETDLQGLLPDSFNLRPQTRNGVAINPGTVESNAIRLVGGPEVYDFRAFRQTGLLVHAPGAIEGAREAGGTVSFAVRGWTGRPYYVLVAGCKAAPRVRVDGQPVTGSPAYEYLAGEGRLILRVEGSPRIELSR